jgi:hypothetical protein
MAGTKLDAAEEDYRENALAGLAQDLTGFAGGEGQEPTETTGLLGDGAYPHGSNGSRKDGWIGFEDFDGLPWWRTPSVGAVNPETPSRLRL